MKTNHWSQLLHSVTLVFVVVFLLGACASLHASPTATLTITPDKTVLTPDLLKKPIVFSGSGFAPNEIVIVEMIVPKGLDIKGVAEGENVGVGNGNADKEGNINIKMGAMTTLNTLFQVEWTPLIKPDFKQARPLPPGDYNIIATGMTSESVGKATMTILPKPAE